MGGQNNKILDVSDPTEWHDTPLSGIAPVDSALRCQVCKDFYNTPMMTSCSHTFCSICIRRCLAVDGKCPTCRGSEQEVKLRRNWALDEVVIAFSNVRTSTLSYARESQRHPAEDITTRPNKRKFEDVDTDGDTPGGSQLARKTRSQTRKEVGIETTDWKTIEIQEEPSVDQDDGLVACPMCGRRMKEESVYLHLDRCEEEKRLEEKSRPAKSRSPLPVTDSPQTSCSGKPVKNLERLPKLNYSLFKENALRKKLNDLGIRSTGPKSVLEKRHTEWVNLWNANCDSSQPRSKREVLQDLDLWERTQGTLAPASAGPGSSLMRKDFDGAAWAASHNSDFQQLIANAKRKKAGTASAAAESEKDASKSEKAELTRSRTEASHGQFEPNDGKSPAISPYFGGTDVASSELGSSILIEDEQVPDGNSAVQANMVNRADSLATTNNTSSAEAVDRPPHNSHPQNRRSPSNATSSKPSQSSPTSLKLLPSSAKPRMFEEADDTGTDAGNAVLIE